MTDYKGYKIVGDGTYGFKQIKPEGKGSVNLELRGNYTNTKQAQIAIDRFLSTQPVKKGAKKDAESS